MASYRHLTSLPTSLKSERPVVALLFRIIGCSFLLDDSLRSLRNGLSNGEGTLQGGCAHWPHTAYATLRKQRYSSGVIVDGGFAPMEASSTSSEAERAVVFSCAAMEKDGKPY